MKLEEIGGNGAKLNERVEKWAEKMSAPRIGTRSFDDKYSAWVYEDECRKAGFCADVTKLGNTYFVEVY